MFCLNNMLEDGPLIWTVFASIYFVFLIVFIIKKKKIFFNITFILFFIYLHMLFVALFLPVPLSAQELHDIRMIQGDAPAVNLIPFYGIAKEIREASMGFEITAMKNVFGNIIAFMPFGFLFPCLMQSFIKFKKFVWMALLVPVGVELTQFVGSLVMQANWRIADIDDVILNMAGMIIGYYLLKLFLYCGKKLIKINFFNLLA